MNFYIKYKYKNKKLKLLYLYNKFLFSPILRNFFLKIYPSMLKNGYKYLKVSKKDLDHAISHYNAKPQKKALKFFNLIYF